MNFGLSPEFRTTQLILLLVGGLFFVSYLMVAVSRIQYPFELEWMEGSIVDHVRRIIEGKSIYVQPSIDFVPCIYTPLYYYLSAIITFLFGPGFFPLRLVSFLSSLGCFFLIFRFVHFESKSKYIGIISACLFCAMFKIGGYWFDIARCDSLFLFLLLATIYIMRFKDSLLWQISAGVVFSLSFFTKQVAGVIMIPVMLYWVFRKKAKVLPFICSAFIALTIGIMILNQTSNGWFSYYVFKLTGSQQIHRIHPSLHRLANFWLIDIGSHLPVVCCLAIPFLISKLKAIRRNDLFYVFFAIGMIGGAWYSRINTSSFNNVILPGYAAVAIWFGLSMNHLIQHGNSLRDTRRKAYLSVVYLSCLLQFSWLAYNPFTQIPTREDFAAGRRFIKELREINGEVLTMGQGFLPSLAGKKTYAHRQAIYDVYSSGNSSPVAKRLRREISEAINAGRFRAIIVNSGGNLHMEEVNRNYIPSKRLFLDDSVFRPVTGTKWSPRWIFTPRDIIEGMTNIDKHHLYRH